MMIQLMDTQTRPSRAPMTLGAPRDSRKRRPITKRINPTVTRNPVTAEDSPQQMLMISAGIINRASTDRVWAMKRPIIL